MVYWTDDDEGEKEGTFDDDPKPRINGHNENYLLTYVRWRNVFFFVTNTTIL